MEVLPSEIIVSEILSKITNPLDRAQFRATCKDLALLIRPIPQPAWLLDQRLPKEIREKEELWEALGRHAQYFPSPCTPFHLSLGKKTQVRIKWYSDENNGRTYNFGVEQKRPALLHVCGFMTPPKAIGCHHSKIDHLAKTARPPPLAEPYDYTWVRSPDSPFCFYISFDDFYIY